MDRQQGFDGFDFDDETLFDKEIEPQTAVKAKAIVKNWQGRLALQAEAAFDQFVRQTGFVHAFEKPGSQGPVDVQRRADGAAREIFELLRNGLRTDHRTRNPSL